MTSIPSTRCSALECRLKDFRGSVLLGDYREIPWNQMREILLQAGTRKLAIAWRSLARPLESKICSSLGTTERFRWSHDASKAQHDILGCIPSFTSLHILLLSFLMPCRELTSSEQLVSTHLHHYDNASKLVVPGRTRYWSVQTWSGQVHAIHLMSTSSHCFFGTACVAPSHLLRSV